VIRYNTPLFYFRPVVYTFVVTFGFPPYMLSFFEKLIQPFPQDDPRQPPSSLYQFCRHYTRGMGWPLLAMACLTACLAVLEV